MSRRTPYRTLASVFVFILLSLSRPASAEPLLAFDEQGVVISGLTPAGRVALFGVARVGRGFGVSILPHQEVLADEDGDGRISVELDPVPAKSIWVAVDLTNGRSTAGAPGDFPVRSGSFAKPGDEALAIDRDFVYVFRVRPGVGAWSARAGDGGEADRDGAPDGTLRPDFAGMQPARGTNVPAPDDGSPGDVYVIIDPNRLDFQVLRGVR